MFYKTINARVNEYSCRIGYTQWKIRSKVQINTAFVADNTRSQVRGTLSLIFFRNMATSRIAIDYT